MKFQIFLALAIVACLSMVIYFFEFYKFLSDFLLKLISYLQNYAGCAPADDGWGGLDDFVNDMINASNSTLNVTEQSNLTTTTSTEKPHEQSPYNGTLQSDIGDDGWGGMDDFVNEMFT